VSLPLALIPIVAQAAPALVRLLTRSDRAGRIAESVVGVIEEATGAPARTEEEALAAVQRLAGDPAAMERLRATLAGMALREAELEQADRADARERDVEVRRVEGGSNRRADMLIAVVVLGLVGCGVGMVWAADEITRTFLAGCGGALLKMLSDAFAFEFGSSRGSADKQRTIESALGAAQGAGVGAGAADMLAALKAGR
jgi:hypothetical protein